MTALTPPNDPKTPQDPDKFDGPMPDDESMAADEALLFLGFDWLKNVMFNEPTVSMKQDVLQGAIARTRGDLGAS